MRGMAGLALVVLHNKLVASSQCERHHSQLNTSGFVKACRDTVICHCLLSTYLMLLLSWYLSKIAYSRDNLTNCLLFLGRMIVLRSRALAPQPHHAQTLRGKVIDQGARALKHPLDLVLTPDCSCCSGLRSVSTVFSPIADKVFQLKVSHGE